MKNPLKSLISILILISDETNATSKPSELIDFYDLIYNEFVKENEIKFNRETVEGKLIGCELDYKYTYRDSHGTINGIAPTIYSVGNFTVNYFVDKHSSVLRFKFLPAIPEINKTSWKILTPTYLNIIVNGNNLEKYKVADFICDAGGKCVGYSDKAGGFEVLSQLATGNKSKFDIEIRSSLTKEGIDNVFNLSSLTTPDNWIVVQDNFNNCMSELVDIIGTDYKNLSDTENTKQK